MKRSRSFLTRLAAVGLTALGLTLGHTGAAVFSAPAQAAEGISRTPAVEATLQRVTRYLNGIKTLNSRFLQISSTGEQAAGRIYLERPQRIRIEYDPPTPLLIVSAGEFLTLYDKELKQASYVQVDSTPAAFLLKDTISFSSDKILIKELREESGVLSLTLAKADDPFGGTVTFVFNTRPLTLRKWTVTDAQGIVTDLALIDSFFGGQLDPKLFEFIPPEETGSDTGG